MQNKQQTLQACVHLVLFLAREYCVLERMHEVIQKGMDSLTQRLGNDLKDEHSHILVPIEYIQGLCLIGNMKRWSYACCLLKSVN
ncbi:hypothetical protein E5E36_01810 [Helicobacter pylori]|uniref:hypothetical protein n=1 Tax=Helicobacter pylori TaxID=210 RepID=UPI00165B729C|nr:hypothetical protein [Helicobacter pylori]WRG20518.1 hypothetical protein E5E30_01805 [Helicobacter pylori]WRG66309.1 hypothetical protein E5E36_01810 [Helicobacter pylori]